MQAGQQHLVQMQARVNDSPFGSVRCRRERGIHHSGDLKRTLARDPEQQAQLLVAVMAGDREQDFVVDFRLRRQFQQLAVGEVGMVADTAAGVQRLHVQFHARTCQNCWSEIFDAAVRPLRRASVPCLPARRSRGLAARMPPASPTCRETSFNSRTFRLMPVAPGQVLAGAGPGGRRSSAGNPAPTGPAAIAIGAAGTSAKCSLPAPRRLN